MPAASSIYWDSVDSQRSTGSSGDANSGSGRHYVDPWDLENYAYLRRHSIATPRQFDPPPPPLPLPPPPPPQQKQRAENRCRSHERRAEPEAEYWYSPREAIREPGYHAPASVEELYFGPSTRQHRVHHGGSSYYQPIYEDDAIHYAAPLPIYAPLSDLEPGRSIEDQRPTEMLKRRSKIAKARRLERDLECFCHGSSSESRRNSVDESLPRRIKGPDDACYVEVAPPSSLGLNTYGHLKIDYASSWNSLHRKIARE